MRMLQLLRFIVSGDSVNFMHKDIKMGNVFVVNTHDTESATLAVGDFGAAQQGEPMVGLHNIRRYDFCYLCPQARDTAVVIKNETNN